MIANFNSDKQIVHSGELVTFFDRSEGQPSEHVWHFENGIPSVTVESQPKVFYSKAGFYDVKYVVSDGLSFDTSIKSDHILVKGIVMDMKFDGYLFDDIQSHNLDCSVKLPLNYHRDRKSLPGKAMQFHKSTRIVALPTLDYLGNEVTVSVWVKFNRMGTINATLVEQSGGRDSDLGFSLSIIDGRAHFQGRDGSNFLRDSGLSKTAIDDGEWHHLVGIMTSQSKWQIWVDGIMESEQMNEFEIPFINNRFPITIGYSDYNSSDGFEGQIDDLKIFNMNLGLTAITELYTH
uniref:LamG-like jellyroll fold domain-containing protein n=1 Tax=Roseivirga sp. TaxID=1964215 RepID=UPI004047EB25